MCIRDRVEGDTNHYLNGYPALYLLPDYASTEESTALDGVNTSRRVLLQMAQGTQHSAESLGKPCTAEQKQPCQAQACLLYTSTTAPEVFSMV